MNLLTCKCCGGEVRVLSKHGAALQTECTGCGLTATGVVSTYLANLREPEVIQSGPVKTAPEVVRRRLKRVDERTAS